MIDSSSWAFSNQFEKIVFQVKSFPSITTRPHFAINPGETYDMSMSIQYQNTRVTTSLVKRIDLDSMTNPIKPFQYSRFQKSFACFLEHAIPLQNEGSSDALLQESFQLFPSICNP